MAVPVSASRGSHVPRSFRDDSFEAALDRARHGDIDRDSARVLYRGARRAEHAQALFSAASQERDARLGRELQLSAHVHMVTRCELSPSCRYCSLSSELPSVQDERDRLPARDLVRAARYAAERGVRSIVLVGGTDPDGSDDAVRQAVRRVREVTDIELGIDVGPSLNAGTVEWLRRQNAGTIYCSIETMNPQAFRRGKPGDDLAARIAFNEMAERHGATLGNVVMNGLGSSGDLLDSILYLRRFRRLAYLYISTFHPVRGTPWARRRPASVRTSLVALAIARLALPGCHLGLAEVEVEDPGSAARTASQLQAGGGNSFAGILIYRHRRVDHLDQIRREASTLGFTTP